MLTGSNTDEDLMRQTLAMLERYNIRAVTSGDSGDLEQVSKWRAALLTASFRLPVFSSLGVTLKGTRCTVHYQNCADWLPKARSQSSLRLLPNTTE